MNLGPMFDSLRQKSFNLSFTYHADAIVRQDFREAAEELDRIIYDDILGEAHRIADLRNGFVEADVVAVDDPDRSW